MRFYERRARGIHESCKFEIESMVSPDVKDGEIDAPVPPIRYFELSDGFGSAPGALQHAMNSAYRSLCSKFSLNWEDAACNLSSGCSFAYNIFGLH